MQLTLAFPPLVAGVAFLPIGIGAAIFSKLSTIVLMLSFGPKPLVGFGMLFASGGMVWLTQLGAHTGYVDGLLGPLILVAIGMGMVLRRRSTPGPSVSSLKMLALHLRPSL
jgi:hypothetical protein